LEKTAKSARFAAELMLHCNIPLAFAGLHLQMRRVRYC